MDTALEDLRDWSAESQFGQTGSPNVPFYPKSQVTVDSLHAKLRIVGKLIEQLTDEAALLDQEMAATTLSLKLSEDELQVFEKYSTEIYSPPPEYDSTNDVSHFIQQLNDQSKQFQCSSAKNHMPLDAIRHLRSAHGKTKEPSVKEKQELVRLAKENVKQKTWKLFKK